MLDNTQPIEVGWYDWDHRLAVVTDTHAFVLNESGWGKVDPAHVTWDGRQFASASDAIDAFSLTWDGIDPVVVAAHVVRGIAPPKPRSYRRYVLVEECTVLQGRGDLIGNILVEFDDGSLRKINGKELSALGSLFPRLKYWRLNGRDDY
jgi:hypothetical protein